MSLDAVWEAIAADDKDLAQIQLTHYWLKTDWWIYQHNAEVEESERVRKEEEDMQRLAEKKKAEIEEDWRQRAELEEKEHQRKEKRKGRAVEENMPEAGPSQSWKWRVGSEEEGLSLKRPKVSDFRS